MRRLNEESVSRKTSRMERNCVIVCAIFNIVNTVLFFLNKRDISFGFVFLISIPVMLGIADLFRHSYTSINFGNNFDNFDRQIKRRWANYSRTSIGSSVISLIKDFNDYEEESKEIAPDQTILGCIQDAEKLFMYENMIRIQYNISLDEFLKEQIGANEYYNLYSEISHISKKIEYLGCIRTAKRDCILSDINFNKYDDEPHIEQLLYWKEQYLYLLSLVDKYTDISYKAKINDNAINALLDECVDKYKDLTEIETSFYIFRV